MEVTDELLYLYMPAVDAAILKNLESRVDRDYEFSKKFERKMGSLMRREAHPWLEIFSGMSRKAATVMGAIAAASLILAMSVEAYRLKFFETAKTFLGNSFLYSYFGETSEDEFRCAIPAYVPDGYVGDVLENDGRHFTILYTNEGGNEILWEQILIEGGEKMMLDSEYDAEIIREIGGGIAKFHLYEDGYISVYYEVGAYVFFIDSDALEADDLEKMLDSINYE